MRGDRLVTLLMSHSVRNLLIPRVTLTGVVTLLQTQLPLSTKYPSRLSRTRGLSGARGVTMGMQEKYITVDAMLVLRIARNKS